MGLNTVYKGINFDSNKLKFYKHCRKWSASLPFASREMEYDLVAEKFEYGFTELFNFQLNRDYVYCLIQFDMEDIFKEAKTIRDSSKIIGVINCDTSRKFLQSSVEAYFEILFEQDFTDVKTIQIPFIDDVRLQILGYLA